MKKPSLLIYFLSFTLLFILFVQTEASAESKKTYDVGTSNLNVRTSPSYDAEVIGHLDKGQQVNSFKEKYGWVQTYYDGELAWVATHYLVETDADSSKESKENASSEKVTITATDVNVRSGPGTSHSVISSATSGDTYKLIESTDSWVKVSLSDGEGWIYAELTDQKSSNSSGSNEGTSEKQSSDSATSNGGNLNGVNIILDPGHGGKDPGSIGLNNVKEKDLINSATDKIAAELEARGATVLRTRSQDAYKTLNERIEISNAYATDAFVSIHFDSSNNSSVKGTSTYYYSGGDDQQLAQSIQNSLVNVGSIQDRGVKHGNYKVLRENKDLGVLIELGFITNADELAAYQSSDLQNQAAAAIADGMVDYFN